MDCSHSFAGGLRGRLGVVLCPQYIPRMVKDFVGRFGEPRRIRMVQRDGQDYYEFNGRLPAGCVLATPSAPPAYIFKTNGEFVTWCADPGDTPDFRSTWPFVSTNYVEFDAIRDRFNSQ